MKLVFWSIVFVATWSYWLLSPFEYWSKFMTLALLTMLEASAIADAYLEEIGS